MTFQFKYLTMENISLAFFLTILICIPQTMFSKQCTNNPIIFNFGDSNSDTGRLHTFSLGFLPRWPYGRTYFNENTGRSSDGRLIIDFLSQSLNTSLLRPYVNLLRRPFSNGTSFAFAGSGTSTTFFPFSLNFQTTEFGIFKQTSSELAALGFRDYISEHGFANALYMIDIGQNNLSGFLERGLSYALQNIPSVLKEITRAVKKLYDLGGRKFWIHNTGPLGCLPQKLATVSNISHDMDSIGCISSYNDAARVFNQGLFQLTQMLRSELKDAVIVHVDIYSIIYDLIANATKYGFSTPFMACCGLGGPPYNYRPVPLLDIPCGLPGLYTVCDPDSRLVSWDGVHYTEAANAFVASKILSADYSTPKLTFDFFCHDHTGMV